MNLDNPLHRAQVQEFWCSPRIASRPGLKAVELFEAVYQGRIKALWIMGTNPVVSLPDADRVRAALARSFRMRDDPKGIVFGLNEFTAPGWQTFGGMLKTPFVNPAPTPCQLPSDQP